MRTLADLAVVLPDGWVEQNAEGELREFWSNPEGTAGLLQVSAGEFNESLADLDLRAAAAEAGMRLGGQGQNWGKPIKSAQGLCGLGRFGFAAFAGGEYPAMLLWLTVSTDTVLMWTWLGPDLASEEVRQAFQVVVGATWNSNENT